MTTGGDEPLPDRRVPHERPTDATFLRLSSSWALTPGREQPSFIKHMSPATGPRELKKGSAELLILSLVDDQARHGYDIARMIEVRSKGALAFHAASMYPLLYRLERRGLIKGRWVEKAGERRRRMYRSTAKGREVLAAQRSGWREFVEAVNRVTAASHA